MGAETNSSSSIAWEANPAEFTAVVLACSVGTRLFPLTSHRHPKHLLPVVGVPILHRLLRALQSTGFEECVVAIQADDVVTIPSLQELIHASTAPQTTQNNKNTNNELLVVKDEDLLQEHDRTTLKLGNCSITVVRLNEDCSGSGEALRQIETMQREGSRPCVHPSSHVVLIPGDLIVLDDQPLKSLIHEHRQGNSSALENKCLWSACTVLLTDVAETDENGVPLKESAKQKKGGLARDEEEIEYVALSYPKSLVGGPRVVFKQPKIDVEEDIHMTGATPKLTLPKQRLNAGRVQVGLDWNDVHVYVLSPWVRQLIQARASTVLSIREDLLPLLISRQYKGIAATFGSSLKPDDRDMNEKLASLLKLQSGHQIMQPRAGEFSGGTNDAEHLPMETSSEELFHHEYAVRATVKASSVLRSHTVPSYLYANREFLNVALQNHASRQQFLDLAPQTETNTKFQSVVLPGATIGDKVTFKSTVVGRGCKIGNKCRLNNVVLVEDVEIGENTILQNTVVASKARIAENCNLNDCQVGPGKSLPAGTKAKVESFVVVDSEDSF